MERLIRRRLAQLAREDQPPFRIERHQPAIKGRIVQPGQAEAVPGIGPVLDGTTPRNDVTGHQQIGERNVGDAAPRLIGRENRPPEEPLRPPHAHDGGRIGFAREREVDLVGRRG